MALTTQITKVSIKGFKSIRSLVNYEPGTLNVFVGPNGAGKSNLIGFFWMMSAMMEGKLQFYIGKAGGAGRLLFDGPEKTERMEVELEVKVGNSLHLHTMALEFAPGDTLVFGKETYRAKNPVLEFSTSSDEVEDLGSGHKESFLRKPIKSKVQNFHDAMVELANSMKGNLIHQFHATSELSRFRQKWNVHDNHELKSDGGNVGVVLLRLREQFPNHYKRIVSYCRNNFPFFDDFVLEPQEEMLLLQWKEKDTDKVFDASMASDGMLRFIALVTLLCQPEKMFPEVLLLDEPELGLHPSALELVAALMEKASHHTQVFLATQSMMLLSQFSPHQVTVVERKGRESVYKKLDEKELKDWLEEYSLGDLWWKNVLGGKP